MSEEALRVRIQELEEQLALSDDGVSTLARRCLALEQELAARVQPEDEGLDRALTRLTLYYDRGLGFSQQDSLSSVDSAYQEDSGTVIASFTMPCEVRAIRLDPGELPCYITELSFSDDRFCATPDGGIALDKERMIFLHVDPKLYLSGISRIPAGMELTVSYRYYPIQLGVDDSPTNAMLQALDHLHTELADAKLKEDERRGLLEAEHAAQCAVLEQQIADLSSERDYYRQAYEAVEASACWKLTAPLRGLMRLVRGG